MKGNCSFGFILTAAGLIAMAPSSWAAQGEDSSSKPGAAAAASPTSSKSKAKVNLNTASKEEIASVPGVGPEMADAIVAARPFKSAGELRSVKGMDTARMDLLLPHVTVRDSAMGGPGSSSKGTASGSDKPGAKAQEKNRAPQVKESEPGIGAPPSAASGKPSAEAQEKNRAPKKAEAQSGVGAAPSPGSGSGKPTAEAQEKNRSTKARSPDRDDDDDEDKDNTKPDDD